MGRGFGSPGPSERRAKAEKGLRWCSRCQDWRALDSFTRVRKTDGRVWWSSHCGKCNTEQSTAWRKADPAFARKVEYKSELRRLYGLSIADFDVMMRNQKGRCAICGRKTRLCVDHDHKTGRIRGLLCRAHNSALGQFQDNPEWLLEAHAYLTRRQPRFRIVKGV